MQRNIIINLSDSHLENSPQINKIKILIYIITQIASFVQFTVLNHYMEGALIFLNMDIPKLNYVFILVISFIVGHISYKIALNRYNKRVEKASPEKAYVPDFLKQAVVSYESSGFAALFNVTVYFLITVIWKIFFSVH